MFIKHAYKSNCRIPSVLKQQTFCTFGNIVAPQGKQKNDTLIEEGNVKQVEKNSRWKSYSRKKCFHVKMNNNNLLQRFWSVFLKQIKSCERSGFQFEMEFSNSSEANSFYSRQNFNNRIRLKKPPIERPHSNGIQQQQNTGTSLVESLL